MCVNRTVLNIYLFLFKYLFNFLQKSTLTHSYNKLHINIHTMNVSDLCVLM